MSMHTPECCDGCVYYATGHSVWSGEAWERCQKEVKHMMQFIPYSSGKCDYRDTGSDIVSRENVEVPE